MARPQPINRRRAAPLYMLAVALGIAAMVPLMRHVEDRPRAAFTVRNDTVWDLTLVVRMGRNSEMPLITIEAESTRKVSEVIVPVDTWRFIWRFADDVGTSTVAHDDLRREDFELVVPDQVEETLLARDESPSP